MNFRNSKTKSTFYAWSKWDFGPTIQGEGKLIGTPSVFIRFGKCNLKCIGFNVEYETPKRYKKMCLWFILCSWYSI